jgi:two-component system sensor histidine kinase QseC
VRYTQPGGRVEVSVDPGAVLEVRDDGPGVPTQEVARLGERFHRPAGQAETGSGLGLSIVLRIAELHGGAVRFSPGLGGRGLAVRVSLPIPAGRRAAGG